LRRTSGHSAGILPANLKMFPPLAATRRKVCQPLESLQPSV